MHHQVEMIDAAFSAAADDDLVLPAVGIVRIDLLDRLIAPLVTANRLQGRCDIVHQIFYPQVLGQLLAALQAVGGRILFRQ